MEQFFLENFWMIIIIGLWTLPWKGVALWKSAQRKEKWWFVVLLLINTVGILEILYIYFFSEKRNTDEDIFNG